MKLHCGRHAQQRMSRRHVSVEDIKNAIDCYHTRFESERTNSITYIGPGIDGMDLKIWALPPGYVDEDTTIIIKSVAWKDQGDPS